MKLIFKVYFKITSLEDDEVIFHREIPCRSVRIEQGFNLASYIETYCDHVFDDWNESGKGKALKDCLYYGSPDGFVEVTSKYRYEFEVV